MFRVAAVMSVKVIFCNKTVLQKFIEKASKVSYTIMIFI